MSPSNKKEHQFDSSDDDENAHSNFMKSSRLLIETTKNKIGRMQTLSKELSHLTSLIKDDREETLKATRAKKILKEGSILVSGTNATHVKVSADKAKKRDSKKAANRIKKMSEGKRMRLIDYTLQKVKEADARDRDGMGMMFAPPPNSPRSSLATNEDDERPCSSQRNHSVSSARYSGSSVKIPNGRNRCQDNPCCPNQTDSHENAVMSDDIKQTIELKFPGGPHKTSDHDVQNRVHFPAMNDGGLVTFKSKHVTGRKFSTMPNFRRHATSLIKEDIQVHSEKINEFKHQELLRTRSYTQKNNQTFTHCRQILTPKIINLQTSDKSFSSSAFLPFDELAIGYRLKLGKPSAFPISLNNTDKLTQRAL